jgi:hypothetical protein
MNPRKSIFDQAPSMQDKVKRSGNWYVKLVNAEVDELSARSDIPHKVKWTWLQLKSLMTKTEVQGVLVEYDEPMTMESLAIHLRRKRPDVLEKEVRILIQHKILKVINGYITCPVLAGRELNRIEKLKRSETGSNQDENTSETNGKHVFQLSVGADVSNPQVTNGKDVINDATGFPLSAKKEVIRTSTSIRNEVTNTSTSRVASKDSIASRSDFDGRTRSLANSEEDEKSHASPRAACDFSNSEEESDNARLEAKQVKKERERKVVPKKVKAHVWIPEEFREMISLWSETCAEYGIDASEVFAAYKKDCAKRKDTPAPVFFSYRLNEAVEKARIAEERPELSPEEVDAEWSARIAQEREEKQRKEREERERIAREEREYAEKVDTAAIKLRQMPQLGDLRAVKDFIEQQSPGLDWSDVWQRAREGDYARCDLNYGLYFGVTIKPKAQRTTSGRFSKREVRTGSGLKGAWVMYTYWLDGTPYSTFKAEIDGVMQGVVEGNKVEFTLELNGDFENIVDAKVLSTDVMPS